jgi:cob(I)alamin adenosyltransferase
LVGGQQVAKDTLRIESYGTVDELNSVLGLLRVALDASPASSDVKEQIGSWLHTTQNHLFNLGSDLATLAEDQRAGQPLIHGHDVSALEQFIDHLNQDLEPLKSFVLPGGGPVCAHLHLARTVCRRAERRVIALAREEAVGDQVIPYMNRLSDAFFVLSRWICLQVGEPEHLWEP